MEGIGGAFLADAGLAEDEDAGDGGPRRSMACLRERMGVDWPRRASLPLSLVPP
jgi:hypothetical protein